MQAVEVTARGIKRIIIGAIILFVLIIVGILFDAIRITSVLGTPSSVIAAAFAIGVIWQLSGLAQSAILRTLLTTCLILAFLITLASLAKDTYTYSDILIAIFGSASLLTGLTYFILHLARPSSFSVDIVQVLSVSVLTLFLTNVEFIRAPLLILLVAAFLSLLIGQYHLQYISRFLLFIWFAVANALVLHAQYGAMYEAMTQSTSQFVFYGVSDAFAAGLALPLLILPLVIVATPIMVLRDGAWSDAKLYMRSIAESLRTGTEFQWHSIITFVCVSLLATSAYFQFIALPYLLASIYLILHLRSFITAHDGRSKLHQN